MPWVQSTEGGEQSRRWYVRCDMCSSVTTQRFWCMEDSRNEAGVYWPDGQLDGSDSRAWCPPCAIAESWEAQQRYNSTNQHSLIEELMREQWVAPPPANQTLPPAPQAAPPPASQTLPAPPPRSSQSLPRGDRPILPRVPPKQPPALLDSNAAPGPAAATKAAPPRLPSLEERMVDLHDRIVGLAEIVASLEERIARQDGA